MSFVHYSVRCGAPALCGPRGLSPILGFYSRSCRARFWAPADRRGPLAHAGRLVVVVVGRGSTLARMVSHCCAVHEMRYAPTMAPIERASF